MSEDVIDAIETVVTAYMDATCNLSQSERLQVARSALVFFSRLYCEEQKLVEVDK